MADTTSLHLLLALLGCLSLGCLGVTAGKDRRGGADPMQELLELHRVVKAMEDKLSEANATDKDLKALEGRLNATEMEVTKLKAEVQQLNKEKCDIVKKLDATAAEVEKLKQGGASKGPSVAFSASLSASGEVYLKDTDVSPSVVYKRVFTNSGNAYDSTTGIFTAPVKGVYFFTFSTFGYSKFLSGAILTKNKEYMVSSYEPLSEGRSGDTGGNSVILTLEAGEQVYMRMWENSQLFDNLNGHTTFSGFLLFPL
ncbi:complement C1q-like protein 2 [Engraulis encrasicolus]|uniref:complement C1q-like protein 2 n=1 Tax=Engraulis encrasicolus TaxID=184585 RepID=UPI002FD38D09